MSKPMEMLKQEGHHWEIYTFDEFLEAGSRQDLMSDNPRENHSSELARDMLHGSLSNLFWPNAVLLHAHTQYTQRAQVDSG